MEIKVNSKDIPAGSTEATDPEEVIASCQSIHAAERTISATRRTELASQEHMHISGVSAYHSGAARQNPSL